MCGVRRGPQAGRLNGGSGSLRRLDAGRDGAEVTIFDGTGVGLQDLAVAAAVVELAIAKGVAQKVEI